MILRAATAPQSSTWMAAPLHRPRNREEFLTQMWMGGGHTNDTGPVNLLLAWVKLITCGTSAGQTVRDAK